MHRRTRRVVAVGVAGALLALPGAAQAKTKSVFVGTPPKNAKAFQDAGVDVNDYFPHKVTIRRGDKVRFLPVGFHTVDLPARGGDPLPLASPTGEKVAGVKDEAQQDFWFNGQDQLGFTPALGQQAWGKKVSFNASKRRNSGLPLANRPKPFVVTFKRKGNFTYYCNVHAGMKGVVSVKKKGAKVPSKKADKKAVKRQAKSSLKVAKQLPKTQPPTGVIDVGVAGPDGEEFFGFVPNALTVSVGSTVRFRMSPGSFDVHTATTGPGNPEAEPSSYLGQLAASFLGGPAFDPRAAYPSDQPPTAATLTPLSHGNGFWNSGVMDTSTASPLPENGAVTFGAPGTYDFYCLIHPFMKGTVTVQ
jgi:plastocyanin